MSFGYELMPFGTHINFYDMLGNYEVKTDQDFVCQYWFWLIIVFANNYIFFQWSNK